MWHNNTMQTFGQIVCPRCREINPPHLAVCVHCGAALAPPLLSPHALAAAEPAPASDLPPLLWALVCFFLALWGLIASGLLQGLLGILTHPYLLAAAAIVSLILTGLFLSERVSREPPPDRLLSSRDLMALSWTAAALLGATQLVKYIVPPMPVITRYEMLSKTGDGCRAEVFIKGEPGDELWQLSGLGRKNEKEVVGIIVRRTGGGSARLPSTVRTPNGDCAIVKYHLMINGREADQVDGMGQ